MTKLQTGGDYEKHRRREFRWVIHPSIARGDVRLSLSSQPLVNHIPGAAPQPCAAIRRSNSEPSPALTCSGIALEDAPLETIFPLEPIRSRPLKFGRSDENSIRYCLQRPSKNRIANARFRSKSMVSLPTTVVRSIAMRDGVLPAAVVTKTPVTALPTTTLSRRTTCICVPALVDPLHDQPVAIVVQYFHPGEHASDRPCAGRSNQNAPAGRRAATVRDDRVRQINLGRCGWHCALPSRYPRRRSEIANYAVVDSDCRSGNDVDAGQPVPTP